MSGYIDAPVLKSEETGDVDYPAQPRDWRTKDNVVPLGDQHMMKLPYGPACHDLDIRATMFLTETSTQRAARHCNENYR